MTKLQRVGLTVLGSFTAVALVNKDDTGSDELGESGRLDPDRRHLPEASPNAGKDRMI